MQVERRQVTVVRPQLGSEDNTQCTQALEMNNCNLVTWHGLTLARVAAVRPKKPRKNCAVSSAKQPVLILWDGHTQLPCLGYEEN